MAFNLRCGTANKAWDFSMDEEKDIAQTRTTEAVTYAIGRPQEVSLTDSKSVTEQKVAHKELFNEMNDYIMEMMAISAYQSNPWDMVKQIEGLLMVKHNGLINRKTIFQSLRRPQAVLKTFRQFVQKSRLNNDRKDPSKWKRAIYLPAEYLAQTDPYGYMTRIDASSKSLNDNVRQSMARFEKFIDDSNKGMDAFIGHLYDVGNLTINNMGLDGISAELNDKKRTKVKVVNSFMRGGETGRLWYVVEDVDGNKKEIPADKLSIDSSEIKQAVVDKFKTEFFNDIMHGQARKLVMKTIPTKTIVNKNKVTIGNPAYRAFRRSDGDGKKLDEILSILKAGLHADNVFTVDAAGFEYTYAMIKSSEQAHGEQYNVYLLSKRSEETDEHTMFIDKGYGQEEYDIINADGALTHFTDGWFKSNEQAVKIGIPFIERDEKGNIVKISENTDAAGKRVFDNFERIEKQPPNEVFEGIIDVPESQLEFYKNIWGAVLETRGTYSILKDEIVRMASSELQRRRKVDLELRREMARQGMPKEQRQAMLDTIYAIGGIKTYTWTDGSGQLHTLNSQFRHKEENYSPVMWHQKDIDDMLMENYHKLNKQAEDTALTDDELDIINEQIAHFKELIYGLDEDEVDDSKIRAIRDSARALTTKNRVLWTDDTLRRKDSQVAKDHLFQTFTNLHSNRLTTDLIESVGNIIKTIPPNLMDEFYDGRGNDVGLINYGINRVKIAQGDVDTESVMSYTKTAEFFNSLPFTGDNHDAESVRKLTLVINGLMTMRYLGTSGAMGNLTQTMNDFIRFGGTFLSKAFGKLNDPKWKDIIANTGVLNIVSMFNDIMLPGNEELKFGDQGFSMLGDAISPIPIPTRNLFNWAKILNLSRLKFADYKNKDFDSLIMRMITMEHINTQQRKDLEYVQEMKRWIDNNKEQLVREKKGQLYDFATLTEEQQNNSPELVEERMQKMLGKIADDKFRKMVSWKLSWFWGGDSIKKWTTFTGTEETLRKLSVIMSLSFAGESGILGSSATNADGVQPMYYTNEAVKIARNTVYATQFGMNQIYLPEVWEGIPRALLQYKSYPMFQMLHDANVWGSFTKGNKGLIDGMSRLLKGSESAVKERFDKLFRGKQPVLQLQDGTVDRDASMALRFLMTRFMASIIGTGLSVIPFVNFIARRVGFGVPLQMIKSAENPAVAISMRIAAWSLLLALYGDDDDDKLLTGAGRSILFLTTPVLLMTIFRDIIELAKLAGNLAD